MIKETEKLQINSVVELLNVIKRLKKIYGKKKEYGGAMPKVNGRLNPNAEFWFRGEHSKDFELYPKVMRKGQCQFEYYDQPLHRFMQEATSYLPNINFKDELLWMEYAQHFGAPTRLLDFTTNPLVALWFSCTSSETDGQIWIVNEHNYSHVSSDHNFVYCSNHDKELEFVLTSQEIPMFPLLLTPNFFDARLSAQSSRFLLWPNHPFSFCENIEERNMMLVNTSVEEDEKIFRYICRIIVKANKKSKILEELDMLGINEKMLFPGLDGVGKYTNYLYRNKD